MNELCSKATRLRRRVARREEPQGERRNSSPSLKQSLWQAGSTQLETTEISQLLLEFSALI